MQIGGGRTECRKIERKILTPETPKATANSVRATGSATEIIYASQMMTDVLNASCGALTHHKLCMKRAGGFDRLKDVDHVAR